jgi:hypothetical protein
MPKMSSQTLKALLMAERADALSAISASKLSTERATALDYYQGNMATYLPAPDGRSKAVSMDTSDTIEGLMPTLMDTFFGGDEVVKFNPVGPEDEAAAEQETDYVNHVFIQGNPGFLVLYSFIKDALLSKTGVVKVHWEEKDEAERETYLDQPPDAFALIVAQPGIDVVEHTEHDGLHDVTVKATRHTEQARIDTIAPEEFGISRNARSIAEANYCFHDVFKSEGFLIDQGFDKEVIRRLPSYLVARTIEEQSRDTVNETTLRQGEDNLNSVNRLIRVTEHYLRMDYEGDDEPRLYRVTTGGEEAEVLTRNGEVDIVEVDRMPFAAMTPVIVTHRFFGRSIADLVKDIQDIKTALLRGMLDNLYLHNNPRVEVSEVHATETTLDDLLVARPGGIVRVKQPGGIAWQEVPDITPSIYPAMQYMDTLREWRTGVSRQGQGTDPNALQNQVATIANQMFSATQAKVKLIARIFAQTGIKDMFVLLHGIIRKHASKSQTVRLRNQWITVDPRDWRQRYDMTVNVGLGTGSKSEQLAHLQLIIAAQEKAAAAGLPIVTPQNFFNSAKQLTRLAGHPDVEQFFAPPGKPADPNNPAAQPIQHAPDPKLQIQMLKNEHDQQVAQFRAVSDQQAAQQKAALADQAQRFDMAHQVVKTQTETALAAHKAQLDAGLAMMQQRMDEQKLAMTMHMEAQKHALEMHHAAQSHAQALELAKAKPKGNGAGASK